MVSDAVIGVLADLVITVLGWMPTVSLPGWLTDGGGVVSTVFGYGASLGAWVPVKLAATVALAVLTAYGVAFIIKIVRIVASYATLGGGSAG